MTEQLKNLITYFRNKEIIFKSNPNKVSFNRLTNQVTIDPLYKNIKYEVLVFMIKTTLLAHECRGSMIESDKRAIEQMRSENFVLDQDFFKTLISITLFDHDSINRKKEYLKMFKKFNPKNL